ncbi:MAG: hypothetical protein JWQ62_2279 [Lacunisphaera sp.]|nr:hypothetical protein [Lacunisphaera sp.]
MRRLLQSIIYNRKLYDRPQDEWTCGRAAEGCPCILGPGKNGECRATGQCLPAKKGDRWVCTRAISLGAACEPGPQPDGTCGCQVPPCRPQRSLRAQRGRFTWLIVSLALGVVLLALWGQSSDEWSSPGPLTAQHAMSTQRCTDCHWSGPKIPISAAARAVHLHQNDQLCIKCHDLGPNGESPHGATSAMLVALAQAQPLASVSPPPLLTAARNMGRPAELACATCHREHQGPEFDLKHMADQQCQVCHQTAFTGFAAGHPEFTGYPYVRRTRLEFDHVAHFQKHFPDPRSPGPAPTSCLQCHEPAQNGRQMLVRNFEQTCAQCHASQIEGDSRAGAKGLVFLRLPGFDLAALQSAGAQVGEWPAFCDGDLTPFMRWMLEGDENARAALATLGAQNLNDLAKATPAQKAAAAELLWSVKGLLADLVTHGQQVIMHRLGPPRKGGESASPHAGQFSADVALAAQRAWLPNLLTEVAAHRRGENPAPPAAAIPVAVAAPVVASAPKSAASDDLLSDPAPESQAAAKPIATGPSAPAALELDSAEDRVAAGGWYRQDETYTINYRPGGHADSFLTAWLEGTAGNQAPAAQAIFVQLSGDRAPGVCMKCHTVDRSGPAIAVNWHAARPSADVRPFTTFKHDAHFSLMGAQGCSTCHTLDAKADYAGGFGANRDPAVFHSNFAPMSKNICAACHQPARAGDNCLECHNYHTGETKNLRVRAGEFHGLPAVPAAPAHRE